LTQPDGSDRPLLDKDVLDRLREEVEDDRGVWRVFVQAFIAQLPRRAERLRLTLTTGDGAGAVDAVLSLKTSCQMVGAERLAELAGNLERSLRQDTQCGDPGVVLPWLAVAYLGQIRQCSEKTANLLTNYLQERPGSL